MDKDLIQDIKNAIEHSGFSFEHYVYNILREHGWQIIANRHYIDDVKGVERELDLLAYKIYTDKIENISYITSLIISCKKSHANKWCFLTRDTDPNDVNTDWTPYHYCTNEPILSYMSKHHRDIITDAYIRNQSIKPLYDFNKRVFSYQVLSEKITSKKQGGEVRQWQFVENTSVYDSIITSIKALAAEKSSRIEQHCEKTHKRYYTFHILSLFDGEMVQSHLDNKGDIVSKKITDISYLNRHIVNDVEDFYAVNFITKESIDCKLSLLDELHRQNSTILPSLVSEFYKDVFEDRNKVDLKWDEFKNRILWMVKRVLGENDDLASLETTSLTYSYDNRESVLEICVDLPYVLPYEDVKRLNEDSQLNKITKVFLEKVFRYKGLFTFSDGLPF